MRVFLSFAVSISLISCINGKNVSHTSNPADSTIATTSEETELLGPKHVENGDLQLKEYLPLLKGKKIGLVVNQSSILGETHLIDTLLNKKLHVKKIFAPEHGIRGKADAGENVLDSIDAKTKIEIISLYGTHKKPTAQDLEGIEIVVFDLQDVGVRFFTYISTMHYVMEACAELEIPVVILDRPNPNGDYIAGPVLDPKYKSFVGMHPIPIVHGLTVGELALMINGENWLKDSLKADLTIIKCKNYTHDSIVPLAIKPSPNLPNINAIRWYPSICLFEETQVSVGRGTYSPFEIYGSPHFSNAKYPFSFTPISIDGLSKTPPFINQACNGEDFRNTANDGSWRLDLLVDAYNNYQGTTPFFAKKDFTHKLCGTDKIVLAIEQQKSVQEIVQLFDNELKEYKKIRANYLLYPDFNEQ